MRKNPRQLEKLISYILSRRPDEVGLVLDSQGYVPLKELIKAITEEEGWGYVRKSHIQEVLMTSSKRPFILEGNRIKANAGDHALNIEEGAVPPKLLYHCVRSKAQPVVYKHGIVPSGQKQVVLATTRELAIRIGRRRDPAPVLLTVQARRAFEAGTKFSRHGKLIYTTNKVPRNYFTGPALPKEKKEDLKSKKRTDAVPEELPGSFSLDPKRSQALQQQRLKQKSVKKEIAWKKDLRRLKRKRRRQPGK